VLLERVEATIEPLFPDQSTRSCVTDETAGARSTPFG